MENKMMAQDYNEIKAWRGSGNVISGISADFPQIVLKIPDIRFEEAENRFLLMPQSLHFTDSMTNATRSQRQKLQDLPTYGDEISFIAKQNVIQDYYKYPRGSSRVQVEGGSTGSLFKCKCIIRPGIDPICWTDLFGIIRPKCNNLLVKALRNVVYNAEISILPKVKGPYKSSRTEIELEFEIARYECPNWNDGTDDSNKNTGPLRIKHMPWNENLPPKIYLNYEPFFDKAEASLGEEPDADEWPKDCKIQPKDSKAEAMPLLNKGFPLKRFFERARFFYFEGGKTLWPVNPKRKILVSGVCYTTYDSTLERHGKLNTLEDGHMVEASLFFCPFNHAFIVQKFEVMGPMHVGYKAPIPKRIEPTFFEDSAASYDSVPNQYLVDVLPSRFTGFYVNPPRLLNTLIDDPKLLLRNIDPKRPRPCPVWVVLNPFDSSLAKCSIVALDFRPGAYSEEEMPNYWQDIFGQGFLINDVTGAVFSVNHSRAKIRLVKHQRRLIPIGQPFMFRASRFRDLYVVVELRPIDRMDPLPHIRTSDGKIYFEEPNLLCFSRFHLNTHRSEFFGLVSDPKELVTRRNMKRDEWPPKMPGFLCEDTDPDRQTIFTLHSLSPPTDREDSTAGGPSTSRAAVAIKPQKKRQRRCRCPDAILLCRDIISTHRDAVIEALEETGLYDRVHESANLNIILSDL